jgi:hypothetical protein
MAAAKHNITVGRGEDFSFTLTIATTGEPVDLTNDLFKAEVRRDAGKPLVATFTVTILNPPQGGVVVVKLPKEETLKLDGNARYKWDLFRIIHGDTGDPAEGDTVRLIYGDLQVENNITDF